jgi:hypothetical protein
MPTPQELETKFWKALESDMTVMLGLDGVEDGHTRPMTAQVEGQHGPIWFFTSTDNALVGELDEGGAADQPQTVLSGSRRYFFLASTPSPCSCAANPLRCKRSQTSRATSRPLVSLFGVPV